MTKVMVLGDVHGNTQEAVVAVEIAGSLKIDTIVQVGDFGLWDHFKDGLEFLDTLNQELQKQGVILIWVDGNHENFDRLEWYVKNNPKTTNGHVFIRTNILYSPRGLLWKMFGRTWMSVGGAVSVDKDWRKHQQGRKQTLWWHQEQLEDDELDKILEKRKNDRVDILLTHDCPTNAPFRGRWKEDTESKIHRQRMDRLGKAVKPTLWFHGHMHTQMDAYPFPEYESHTTVYGVDRDTSAASYGILDTDTMEFEWPDPRVMHSLFYSKLDEVEPADQEGEWVEWKDPNWTNDDF